MNIDVNIGACTASWLSGGLQRLLSNRKRDKVLEALASAAKLFLAELETWKSNEI